MYVKIQSNFQSNISDLCFDYNAIWDETLVPMSEAELYSLVNNYYLQFQKAFSDFSGNNLLYQEFIFRSFQFLAETIVLGISLIFYYKYKYTSKIL